MRRSSASPSTVHPPGSGGYTLLELLLVLSILLVAAGMTWPTVEGLYQHHHLQQAGEQVRVELARSRIRAVDTGLIYQFRFEPQGRRFLIVPFEPIVQSDGSQPEAQSVAYHAGELPESLRFEASSAYPITVQQIGPESLAGLPGAGELAAASWSPPLLFSSDGTALDAAFNIVDEHDRFLQVSVRGLTAAVTLGAVRSRGKP